MEIKKIWTRSGNQLFLADISTTQEALDNVIYILSQDEKGQLFLEEINKRYEFDFKIYGLETDFINRVKRTYANTTGNLGVLLNGVKGTGKTITAEIIANEINQPIILINTAYNGTNTFLSSIQQDITIFIDEYEKTYSRNLGTGDWDDDEEKVKNGDSSLLSLMDGTFKTKFRKVFLLTTNNVYVNDNMLNRPGRIRYLKEFGDLNMEQIMEIIEDCLVEKKYTEDIIDFIKPLKIITVDIIKSIVSEVNIFNEIPQVCCKDFNLQFKTEVFTMIKVLENAPEEILLSNISSQAKDNFLRYARRGNDSGYLEIDGVGYSSSKKQSKGDTHFIREVGDYNEKNIFPVIFRREKPTHKAFIF